MSQDDDFDPPPYEDSPEYSDGYTSDEPEAAPIRRQTWATLSIAIRQLSAPEVCHQLVMIPNAALESLILGELLTVCLTTKPGAPPLAPVVFMFSDKRWSLDKDDDADRYDEAIKRHPDEDLFAPIWLSHDVIDALQEGQLRQIDIHHLRHSPGWGSVRGLYVAAGDGQGMLGHRTQQLIMHMQANLPLPTLPNPQD